MVERDRLVLTAIERFVANRSRSPHALLPPQWYLSVSVHDMGYIVGLVLHEGLTRRVCTVIASRIGLQNMRMFEQGVARGIGSNEVRRA